METAVVITATGLRRPVITASLEEEMHDLARGSRESELGEGQEERSWGPEMKKCMIGKKKPPNSHQLITPPSSSVAGCGAEMRTSSGHTRPLDDILTRRLEAFWPSSLSCGSLPRLPGSAVRSLAVDPLSKFTTVPAGVSAPRRDCSNPEEEQSIRPSTVILVSRRLSHLPTWASNQPT